jgi:hypothetical protein
VKPKDPRDGTWPADVVPMSVKYHCHEEAHCAISAVNPKVNALYDCIDLFRIEGFDYRHAE